MPSIGLVYFKSNVVHKCDTSVLYIRTFYKAQIFKGHFNPMNNTLIKGLKLLELLARQGKPVGVSELAVMMSSPKSGVHRLLQALVEMGYVKRSDAGAYLISIKLWELGSAALPGLDLRRYADAVMEGLMQEAGESVHLSVLDHYEVVYVHKVESANPVRAYTQIGGRAPAFCVATGKAMTAFKSLAWLTEASQSLVRFTPRTIVKQDAFLAEMQKIKKLKFAINRGEWRESVHGLAAPILDSSGSVIAAIGVSGPANRLPLAKLKEMASLVTDAADALSVNLGNASSLISLASITNQWQSSIGAPD